MLIKKKLLQIEPLPCPKGIKLKSQPRRYGRETLIAAVRVIDGIVIVDGYDRNRILKKRFFADGKNWQYYDPENETWNQRQDGGWFDPQLYVTKEIPEEAVKILKADSWSAQNRDLGRMISDYTRLIDCDRRQRYQQNKHDRIKAVIEECEYEPKDLGDWLMKDVLPPISMMTPKDKKHKQIKCLCCGHTEEIGRLRHKKVWVCPHCGRSTIAYDKRYMESREDKTRIAIPKKIEGGFAITGMKVWRRFSEEGQQIVGTESFQIWRMKDGDITRLYDPMSWFSGFNYSKYMLTGDFYLYTRSLKRVFPEGKYMGTDLTRMRGTMWPVFDLFEKNHGNVLRCCKAGLFGIMSGSATKPLAESFSELTGLDQNYIHEFRENRYDWAQVHKIKCFTEVFGKKGTYNPQQLKIMDTFDLPASGMATELETLRSWMTDEKVLNYFSRQMKLQNRGFTTVADLYIAYIDMANALIKEGVTEIDLSKTYFRYPKDIKEAHDRMEMQFRAIKQREENKNIKAHAEEYRQIPQPGGKFIALFPENEAEFLEEGNALHHCVGWNPIYREGQASGEMITFFIRKKEHPDEHYFTATYKVKAGKASYRESYGEQHKTPGKEVRAFIDAFMNNVNQALMAEGGTA